MKYNFDEVVDRRNTNCIKWDTLESTYGSKEILPMWIADMDFKSSDEIIDKLRERVDHGVFGYNFIPDSTYESIINWAKTRYNWDIKKEWILFMPGVVAGFNLGIRILTEEKDGVIIQPPVYPPFFRVINNNNRTLVTNPLTIENGKYTIDFEDLEKKLKTAKVLLLCSPHNPVGRVWTREELERIAKLCVENDVFLISDEIHCDLIFKGNKHTNIASLSKDIEEKSITLIAPSKTFNIAGLFTSIVIIPNEEIRKKYEEEIFKLEIGHVSIFGAVGLEAAYTYGQEWLEEALIYIEGNTDYAIDYIRNNIPKINVIRPEGTYLLWLDCRQLGLSQEELNKLMIEKGKVLLNDGSTFGKEGEGFLRLNIGCPRSMVEEALKRIEYAVNSL
ncbi:MAG: pyridoxal phosphate-dependent aminotransferase [Tissierellia bacterium]|nr:pyridoxal phosphate-dependent aminotransferase [Tissierellia bacterium]